MTDREPGVVTQPPCYNRPPHLDGRIEHGISRETGQVVAVFIPHTFEQRCATHDGRGIGPNGEGYPSAHGWDCGGCRWMP